MKTRFIGIASTGPKPLLLVGQIGVYSNGVQERVFHGFTQFKQPGEGEPWKFHVVSFDGTTTGEAGWCSVLNDRRGTTRVCISSRDALQINGRGYGRRFWTH